MDPVTEAFPPNLRRIFVATLIQDSVVVNTVNIHDVAHQETVSTFKCRAHNNNITLPVSKSVNIKINFPPSDVKIVGLSPTLLAGKSQKLKCVSVGSRPGASLSWWKDDELVGQPGEVYNEERVAIEIFGILTNS